MTFDFDAVRDIVRCPKSHSPLIHDGEALICTDATCRLKFPIRDDIPILLLDEAEELSEDAWRAIISRHAPPASHQP